MKIKYTGTKQRMSVTLPVGFGRLAQKGVLHFAPNDIHELSDEEGQKLLDLNKEGGYFVAVNEAEEANGVEEIPENLVVKRRGRPRKEA